MVPNGAVQHYLSCVRARYPLTPDDRVAAPTDLSFDLSVNDMFLAWSFGASLPEGVFIYRVIGLWPGDSYG